MSITSDQLITTESPGAVSETFYPFNIFSFPETKCTYTQSFTENLFDSGIVEITVRVFDTDFPNDYDMTFDIKTATGIDAFNRFGYTFSGLDPGADYKLEFLKTCGVDVPRINETFNNTEYFTTSFENPIVVSK